MPVPNLTYGGSPFVWRKGEDVGTITPGNTGDAATSRVIDAGAVPAGVALAADCAITGTPTTERAAADIVFTPSNGSGAGPQVTVSAAVVNALLDGLEAAYEMDDPDVLADAMGVHPASDTGGVTTVAGKIDEAARFNGSSQYLTVGHAPALQPSDKFTLSFWAKRGGAGVGNIFNKYPTLLVRDDLLSVGDVICYVEGTSGYGYTDAGKVSASVFTHVVVVYDGSFTDGDLAVQNAGRLKIYVAGSPETLTFDATTIPASISANTTDITMGGPSFFYNGDLDLVHFWPDRALDVIDVANLNNGGAGLSSADFDSVNPAETPDLSYYGSPFAFGEGLPIRSIAPGNAGGGVTAASVDGAGDPLPTGLTLASNGSISGTPTELGTFDVLVNNENSGVAGPQASVTIEVRAGVQLGGISYAPNHDFNADDLALSNDADVSSWVDPLGGLTLTGVSSFKPKFKTSVLNGIKAVSFGGAASPSKMTAPIVWTNFRDGITIFAVWRNTKFALDGASDVLILSYSALASVDDVDNLIFGKAGDSGGMWHVLGGKQGVFPDNIVVPDAPDFMSCSVISYSKPDSRYRVKYGLVNVSELATGYLDIADAQLDVGGQTDGFGSPFKGYLFRFVIYTAPLSDADVDAVKADLEVQYDLDVAPTMVLDGDSIVVTDARPAWPGYTFQMMTGANVPGKKWGPIVDLAVGGNVVSQVAGRVATAAGYIDPARAFSAYCASAGTNDLAGGADPTTLAAAYKALLVDARSQGFDKIIACTIIARTGGFSGGIDGPTFEANKNTFNGIVNGWSDGTWDTVSDFAADSIMGDPAQVGGHTTGDGIHPNAAGASRMAVIFAAAVEAMDFPTPSVVTGAVAQSGLSAVVGVVLNGGEVVVTGAVAMTSQSVVAGSSAPGDLPVTGKTASVTCSAVFGAALYGGAVVSDVVASLTTYAVAPEAWGWTVRFDVRGYPRVRGKLRIAASSTARRAEVR